MQSPSYFSGIVKILETPQPKVLKNKITTTQFRALLPQSRKNKFSRIVKLTFWGKLASDIKNYYQMDDYILIEGYVSIFCFAQFGELNIIDAVQKITKQ